MIQSWFRHQNPSFMLRISKIDLNEKNWEYSQQRFFLVSLISNIELDLVFGLNFCSQIQMSSHLYVSNRIRSRCKSSLVADFEYYIRFLITILSRKITNSRLIVQKKNWSTWKRHQTIMYQIMSSLGHQCRIFIASNYSSDFDFMF